MKIIFLYIVLLASSHVFGQTSDPEFSKGFILHARLHNGLITRFDAVPDLYIGGIELVPQFTVIEHKLRAGIIAGSFYANNLVQWNAGATASFKLKTLKAGIFGSAANIHLSADHLWASNKQRLLGLGAHLDILNRLVLGLSAHRDYHLNNWWLQQSIGIRISKTKKVNEPFN